MSAESEVMLGRVTLAWGAGNNHGVVWGPPKAPPPTHQMPGPDKNRDKIALRPLRSVRMKSVEIFEKSVSGNPDKIWV
jgi:hypothetical protein